jgi:hypothetical protein
MNTQAEFVSDAFPSYPGEDEQINPGIWGKKLAEYLAAELPKHGVTPKEFYTEDWGWEIPIENEAFPMFIGCSNQLEPGGNRFLCFIDPSTPQVRKGFFKKIDATSDIKRVADALDKILKSHSGIKDLNWSEA